MIYVKRVFDDFLSHDRPAKTFEAHTYCVYWRLSSQRRWAMCGFHTLLLCRPYGIRRRARDSRIPFAKATGSITDRKDRSARNKKNGLFVSSRHNCDPWKICYKLSRVCLSILTHRTHRIIRLLRHDTFPQITIPFWTGAHSREDTYNIRTNIYTYVYKYTHTHIYLHTCA